MFEKKYIIEPDPPKAMDINVYIEKRDFEYRALLENDQAGELLFQSFFERNPAYLPGAFEVLGESGHYPFMNCLISQPKISDERIRIPDFMWLANDSLSFCPVFIEIEKPSKKQFRQDEVNRAEFTQAYNQINEWRAILSTPSGQESFYDRFSIDNRTRQKVFKPQYVLVYGRRSEYENNEWLRKKRALIQQSDCVIMSFDRLQASRDVFDLVTCKVSNGIYNVLHIPPTFVYRPATASVLKDFNGFSSAISRIPDISDERRAFLQARFDYWMEYGKNDNLGILNAGDFE